MDELTLARVVHLLGVVLWIGGVAMITTILLPVTAKNAICSGENKVLEHVENRFAA